MKSTESILVSSLLVVAVCIAAIATPPVEPTPRITIPGEVAYHVDGDTIDVVVESTIRVRLKDCWAPEPYGEEKAEGLKSKANIVKLAPVGSKCMVDVPLDSGDVLSFGRVVGYVYVEGKELGQAQCAAGHATSEKQ